MIFLETSPEMMLKIVFSVCYWKKQTGNYFLKIFSLKVFDILQNFFFYHILNSENFKMEVEQMYFVSHYFNYYSTIYYWLSKNPSVKIWSNKFQMVMINKL